MTVRVRARDSAGHIAGLQRFSGSGALENSQNDSALTENGGVEVEKRRAGPLRILLKIRADIRAMRAEQAALLSNIREIRSDTDEMYQGQREMRQQMGQLVVQVSLLGEMVRTLCDIASAAMADPDDETQDPAARWFEERLALLMAEPMGEDVPLSVQPAGPVEPTNPAERIHTPSLAELKEQGEGERNAL